MLYLFNTPVKLMMIFSKRKVILFSYGLAALIFFLLSANATNAKTVYSPTEIIFNAPVVKTLNKFYSQNLPIKKLVLAAGVECGGGDQTKINLGPVIENVTSCNECENLAACAGEKKGVSNVGYLWDSVTKKCGLGIEVTKAEAESCQEEDECLGVNETRFNEIKDDVLGAVDAVKNLKETVSGSSYFTADDVAPAELLLALTWVESRWDTLFGNTTYNGNLPFSCPGEETALDQMCSDINFGMKMVDTHGKECREMPISDDPDGAGSICDGKMGIGQFLPSVYLARTILGGGATCVVDCVAGGGSLNACMSTCQYKNVIGEIVGNQYPDPWDRHDGIYTAETILTIRHANFDGSGCVNDCVAGGQSIDTCLRECSVKKERCAIIDYHFGAGTCATAGAVEDAFVAEVRNYKPVMKNLLDTGNCEGKTPGTCKDLAGDFYGPLPVDRFNEIFPIVQEMSEKVFTEFGFSVRPEFILAVLHTESGWTPDPGVPPNPGEFCIFPGWNDWNTFNGPNICGNPNVEAEIMTDFGQSCNTMNVSADPNDPNIDPPCGGAMGMAQFIPGTWVGKIPQILQITGRSFANPYNERDIIAAAAIYLGQLLDNCGGSEELASGAYYTGACAPGTAHWMAVSLRLPFAEDMVADACAGAPSSACPVGGCYTFTGEFCPFGPCQCHGSPHRGIDFAQSLGSPVYAVEDGMTLEIYDTCDIKNDLNDGCGDTWGNHVLMVGNDTGYYYMYAHLRNEADGGTVPQWINDDPNWPRVTVKQGDIIGYIDSTGSSTGNHLHFEVGAGSLLTPNLLNPGELFDCIPTTNQDQIDACGTTICVP